MTMANSLAYYNAAIITALKSFIVQAPGFYITNLPEYLLCHSCLLLLDNHFTYFTGMGV